MTIGKHGIVYVSRDTTFQGPLHLGPQSSLFESNGKVRNSTIYTIQTTVLFPSFALTLSVFSNQTSNSLFLPQEQVHQVSNVSGAGDW